MVLDLQGAQRPDRDPAVGRHALALAEALARGAAADHELCIALDGSFADTIEPLRARFAGAGLVPNDRIAVWKSPGAADPWRAAAADRIREAFLARLAPDLLHVASLPASIGVHEATGCTSVTLYDLVPDLRDLENLRRAHLVLAPSEPSRRHAVEVLGLPAERVVSLSAPVDAQVSWDECGRRTLEAFDRAARLARPAIAAGPRRRLAYVAPVAPPADADPLLPALSRHYRIDVIADHARAVWFLAHGHEYERILYHVADSQRHMYVFELLRAHPGVVVLQDFFLGGVLEHMQATGYAPGIFDRALFESHGYVALKQRSLPANLPVLNQATGVIVRSEDTRSLAAAHYGKEHGKDWAVVPLADPDRTAVLMRDAIERFACTSDRARRARLVADIAALPAPPADEESWLAVAQAIAANHPPHERQRQLLLDVSELVRADYKSGIQRVIRGVIKELMAAPPDGHRIDCVYVHDDGLLRYARAFTAKLYGCASVELADEPVDAFAGDLFFGVDFSFQLPRVADLLRDFRARGVGVLFLIYDILALRRPECFPPILEAPFKKLIALLAELADGLVCISRAVADDVIDWLDAHPVPRPRPLQLGWFHLGADLHSGFLSSGLAPDFEEELVELRQRRPVLMVGTIEPRKGHAQALAAFELLWARGVDATLVIAGKQGWMVDELAERLKAHPELGHCLFWFDSLSDEAMVELYRTARGLLIPSEGEGFGLPIVEAAYHGKPVLARSLPVFREIGGEHLTYFAGLGAAELADAIESWLAAIAEGRAPRPQGVPILTWAQAVQQLRDVILSGKWYRSWSAPPSAANEVACANTR